jgi:triosephosphate isomerase (TIM)
MWSDAGCDPNQSPDRAPPGAGLAAWSEGRGLKYFLANWKMHTTVDEAVALCASVQQALGERVRTGQRVPVPIICPPYVSLVPLDTMMDQALLRLGAQNCHWEPSGPYTGEISPTMLEGVVDYVMVGHSERRAAGETDAQVSRKVAAIARARLVPILFVGEEEPTESAGDETDQQLTEGLAGIDVSTQPFLVVYEPAWAIGAEQAADPEHVNTEVGRLKDRLGELGASRPEVIYGGTVNDGNVDQFVDLEILDGVGATRASLEVDGFLRLVDRLGGGG